VKAKLSSETEARLTKLLTVKENELFFEKDGKIFARFDSINLVFEREKVKTEFYYKGERIAGYDTIHVQFDMSTITLKGFEGHLGISGDIWESCLSRCA
jgi:hypothetical protein